jgi:ribosomal protein L40E
MQCQKCGHQNPDDAENCQQCGINLAWAAENLTESCPACSTQNPAFAEKCSNCGLNLEWAREEQKRKERELAAQEKASLAEVDTKGQGRKLAGEALTAAIVGIFLCGIAFEPYAIYKARKAKEILAPGEEGWGKANTAEIMGWIFTLLWVVLLIVSLANSS